MSELTRRIIFAVIANLLSLLNVSTFLQDAFRGALILVTEASRPDLIRS